VNVIQKDKENENIPFSNCFLQVVDLAGSERIAKSTTCRKQLEKGMFSASSRFSWFGENSEKSN